MKGLHHIQSCRHHRMVAEHRGDFPPAVDLAQQRGVRQGEENWSCWTRQRSRLGAVAVATSNVAPLVRSRPEYGPTLVLELSMTLWPLSRRRSWSGPSKYEVRRQFRAPPRGGRRSQATISTRTMAMAPAAIAVPKTSNVPTSMFLQATVPEGLTKRRITAYAPRRTGSRA